VNILLNPAILYALLWIGLLFLYELKLSTVLLPLTAPGFVFFSATVLAFLGGYLMFVFATGAMIITPTAKRDNYRKWVLSRRTGKILRSLAVVLVLGLGFELVHFRNLPLLSLLGVGVPISYTEFGFPGIHGLFNAIFLVICTVLFVRQLLAPNPTNGLLLITALAWPILLVSRQLLFSLIVQFVFLFILVRGISSANFLKLLFLSVGLMVVFGYIGDLRSGRQAFLALARPPFDYPEYIPSGFLWVYVYMVSPLNNVINNLDIAPVYAPIGLTANLLPSFARDYFMQLLEISLPQWQLVDATLNVSSMHQKYIMDFGMFFTCIIYLFMSFAASFLTRLSRLQPKYGFALVVFLHGIIFSFFVDFILHLVFFTQFFLYIFLFDKCGKDA
jgi:oligosaccharide repeat unit polymerase